MRKESDAEIFNCIICKEDRHYFSIGQCEHRKVCNYCSLRSRILYKDKRCPICTAKLESVFIYESTERPSYAEMEANKYYFYEDDDFNENGIYYSTMSAKEEALKLKSFICPLKSCPEGAFDNLQTLCNHISKTHKRYYCETCLKEGKKFLSEMKIYNYETLNEHIAYGEYSEKGSLVIPPHPMCGFCGIKFYNDEHLFKHMNEHHFICQLCRDKKNIVFYKEISQLLSHYKDRHFVCPYQECLEDMFVVFESEEKLNSHLVTKHKCIDAQNRLTSFHVTDKKMTDTSKNFQTKQGNYNSREEFNFTLYINELKDRVKDYIKNFSQRRQSQNSYSDYKNDGDYDNVRHNAPTKQNYNNYNVRNGRENENTNANYNNNYEGNDYYNEQDQFNHNSEYGRGGKNKSRQNPQKRNNRDNYNQGYNQNYDQNYEQNYNQGSNQQNYEQNYQGHNEQNYYNNNDYYRSNNSQEGTNKKRDKNKNAKYGNAHDSYSKQSYQSNTSSSSHSNANKNYSGGNKLQPSPKIDYSFIFNSVLKIVKDYIIQKIQKENPPEEDFIVPRETIYQLIVIIDKLDNEKLLELTSLTNFGIDLDVYRELKRIVSTMDGSISHSVYKVLDECEIRKVLIVYKYFATAQKKIDELEQIDPDLYEDFAFRQKSKKQKEVSQVKKNPPKENKIRLTNDSFPTLKGNKPETQKDNLTSVPLKGKLNSLFEAKCTVTNDTKNQTKINLSSNNNTTTNSYSSKENKLTMLFDNKAVPVPKKEVLVLNKKKINKNSTKYDEDFPEL